MQHVLLVVSLMVSTAYTSLAMEPETKIESPSEEIRLCLKGIRHGNVDTVKKGLSLGADVNYIHNGTSLFYLAHAHYNRKIIKTLTIHENIDLTSRNATGCTPLHYACLYELPNTVDAMLRKNQQVVSFINRQKNTPLHMATVCDQQKCVEIILSHNTSTINHQNENGYTPLHYACCKRQRNLDIIKQLIEKGAHTTIQNSNQRTPLYLLFWSCGTLDVFNNFLTHCDQNISNQFIHATDEYHNTQFHLCATVQNLSQNYLNMLSSKGLDITAKNNNGETASDLACAKYNELYTQCISEQSSNNSESTKKALDRQERTMHNFLLCITSPCIKYALFALQEITDEVALPQELKLYLIYLVYELHLETIVAKKYQNNKNYYHSSLENKNTIRRQLLEKPEYLLLWDKS